jgi:hypothetical protein
VHDDRIVEGEEREEAREEDVASPSVAQEEGVERRGERRTERRHRAGPGHRVRFGIRVELAAAVHGCIYEVSRRLNGYGCEREHERDGQNTIERRGQEFAGRYASNRALVPSQ